MKNIKKTFGNKSFSYGSGVVSSQNTVKEIWLQVCVGATAGNTLDSGQFGVKKIYTTMNDRTDWLDVWGDTAELPDGLGRATIWYDGVQQFTADADLFAIGTSYAENDKVSYLDIGYKCTVAGTASAFNTGATFVEDPTIPKKPKRVFILLDSRAQFEWAILHNEWIRTFTSVKISDPNNLPTNPSTGAEEAQVAYVGSYF